MAGVTDITKAPYPTGGESTVAVRIGGFCKQGRTTQVVDTWLVPWDCTVYGVDFSYAKTDSNHLDAITLATVDDSKTIVASLDASADIAGVAQTLHADIVGYQIQKGDVIKTTADSSTASEEGLYMFTLHLRPKYPG